MKLARMKALIRVTGLPQMSSMKLQKSCTGYYKQHSSRNAILQPVRSFSQTYTGSPKRHSESGSLRGGAASRSFARWRGLAEAKSLTPAWLRIEVN